MRILQICYKYPPFFSGYGKQLHTVNQEITKDDTISVTVLTAYGKNKSTTISPNFIVKSLFETESEKSRNYFYLFSAFVVFRYLVFFIRADVIHIVKAGPELIIPTMLAKLLGKKVIIKVAQDDLEALLPHKVGLLKKIRRFFIRKADIVVALSQKIVDEALGIGVSAKAIRKIPNSVDTSRFKYETSLAAESTNSRVKRYVFIGSISRRKGVVDLLDALLIYQGSNIYFTLAGPLYDVGDFEERLVSINQRGFVNIKYVGEIDRPEDLLEKNDCLVLPSYSEGMPNVVLEAAACGLYLLLSDISIHKELLNILDGYLFTLGNKLSILSSLSYINKLELTPYHMASQSRQASSGFSVDVVSRKYLSIYII